MRSKFSHMFWDCLKRSHTVRSRHLTSALAQTLSLARPLVLLLCLVLTAGGVAHSEPADERRYDTGLLRLSEILGSIHYLRELCAANDGMAWRDQMRDLLRAEGSSALRRARLTKSFNKGYQDYARTYSSCTPSARVAIKRFLTSGAKIAQGLVDSAR